MAINTPLAQGLLFSRNFISGANTFQANRFKIKVGYGTAIGFGDLVKTLTGASQGYIGPALTTDTAILGVFAGVEGYFDNTAQQYMHGLNGSWPTNANPSADVPALVISDPFAVFRVQMIGGPYTELMRGQNINFSAGTNGAPSALGISTLTVDATTINTTPTLPLRIVGVAGVAGGPNDPGNTNPIIEVRLNTSEALAATGI